MSEERTIHLVEIPIGGKAACLEPLARRTRRHLRGVAQRRDRRRVARVLQTRLRKIDELSID